MIVEPEDAQGQDSIGTEEREKTQPWRSDTEAESRSKQGRQGHDQQIRGRRKFLQKFAVQQGVERVEVDLGTGHRAERRVQFVFLPLSFRANDDDFVPQQFAGLEIVFPVFGHKDLKHGMRPEARSRRPGKADKMLGEIIGNQFGMASFRNGTG